MNDLSATAPAQALQPGTRLAELEVERVLGVGGFGIVYLAFDHALQRRVAVKEFMPASLAERSEQGQVGVRPGADATTFALALRSFVNEARLLARFDHPALVKVHRFWEAQGTAYMVMPFYEGPTLRAALASMQGAPDEAWLRALLEPLLGALEVLHGEQVYHRDVAPDNILVLPSGAPVLLDFGAARHVLTGGAQALTAILKPDFAPIEQYGESTQMRQGAWTDLYALGAVLYFCIAGRPPSPAASRMLEDDLPALGPAQAHLRAHDGSSYSERLLACIDAALSVQPQARPQSVTAFRAALGDGPAIPQDRAGPPADYPKTVAWQGTATAGTPHAVPGQAAGQAGPGPGRDWWWTLQYVAVALFIVGLTWMLAGTTLFESAVIVRRQLAASDLVRALGQGAGLAMAWRLARRAAAQLRDAGGSAAQLHRLVIPLCALVVLSCSYAVLLPVLRPVLGRSLQTACMWAFVACIVASAAWLAVAVFERAELLVDLGRRGVSRARRALLLGARTCSGCQAENAGPATSCRRCGTALDGVGG